MAARLTINGRRVQAPIDMTLFEAAAQVGVRVPTSCVKQGKCKECLVEVTRGAPLLTPATDAERHLAAPFRLSCQARVGVDEGDIECHTMRRGHMRIERHAVDLPVTHQQVPLEPAVTRAGDRILIDGHEVARLAAPIHGLALDLGTTTIVLRLVNLETGEIVADGSFENPQRFGGSDVMSRIHYDTQHPGKLLRRALAGYLTHAIEEIPVDPRSIFEVVVVGNSTMRDLFFRQSVHTIGQNPYRSITEIDRAEGRRPSTRLVETGRRCLLPVHPNARVYGAPIISGHVGADAAACMLAVGLDTEERLVAIMDIGTNTELILGNRHRVLAASCPAGPAFEGGAISCGMPGLEGAIEDVAIDDDGRCRIGVIGGGVPEGVCGSGLVDLLSELRRTGRMNEMGRFEDGSSEFVVDATRQIRFLERDVNELAQAKGANVAGLQVVCQRYGIRFDQIDVFYLAGGFGRHLKPAASRRIGLIPDLPDPKIVQVGNAAIEGATIALVSASRRAALERMVETVEHCRLETHPDFFDYFVDGCQFKPLTTAAQVA
jgi:uncharacterized 2Fe-2S/4Fe-4S cluster protein (DUF4445 family)